MSNLFLFTNAFCAKMLIPCIGNIVNFSIENIILMKENHLKKINDKVILCSSLIDAINIADIIMVINDDFIPKSSVELIKKISDEIGKQCYVVQNQWTINSSSDIIVKDYYGVEYDKHPSILNISTGTVAQQLISEVILNNILNWNNIEFKQIFSAKTKRFLLQLKEYGILNNALERHFEQIDDYDVIVSSIDIGEKAYVIREYFDLFKMVSPDFTIFQSGAKFSDYNQINNFLECLNFSRVGFYIKSHYYLYENSNVYCSIIPKEDTDFYAIDFPNLEKVLSFDLFSQIAFPKGVILL